MLFMEIRNIAIIAHVDHGKTTLTDAIMRQTGMFESGMSMDTNTLEQERGITIYSKNGSFLYKDTKVNVIDTPGHADFGSEVERILRSIDSVLLLVDAQEGPMPQTRFVLKKSLELGLKPLVIINKIDKPAANPERAHDQVLELFFDLGANEDQLEFTTIYANGRDGIAMRAVGDESEDLTPLLDAIIEHVKPAGSNNKAPVRAQVFNLGYDEFVGRLAICRLYEGVLKTGDKLTIKTAAGDMRTGTITNLYSYHGLTRKEVQEASAGDIVMIAGIEDITIGETICGDETCDPLPAINIDEPTMALNILVNNSPFAGREGKFVTSRQIRDRLERELEVNVGLQIDFSKADAFEVSGRGELHIAILLEQMRREGYELQISQPHVLIKEIDGIKSEPFEEITIDTPSEYQGTIIEKLGRRMAKMTHMEQDGNNVRMTFEGPTRGIFGYRNKFIIDTKGEGIFASRTIGYRPHVGVIEHRAVGSMVSMVTGKALGFALFNLQDRGALYIGPQTEVYEGMVIGDAAKGNDLAVNPTKGKELTNMRSSGADEAIKLTPPKTLDIETGMETMSDDEYLEITPNHIRLRKALLNEVDRKRARNQASK